MNSKEYIQERFPFDKPLRARQRKDFIEYLSLEILKHCFGDTYRDFFVTDKPDIQNKDGLVGIEVTEAISMADAQIEGEFVKYRTKDEQKGKKCSKAIIEANGGRLDGFILSYPVKDSEIERKEFQNAIRKKIEKIKSYKEKGFEKLGLFIYYKELPIPFDLDDVKSWFDDVMKVYNDKYDFLFLSYPCGVIFYDIGMNDIQMSVIGREKYQMLQYSARVSAEEKYKNKVK